jgi:hypothetical protein
MSAPPPSSNLGKLTFLYFSAIKKKRQPGTMAHTCNPSYSGSRDQEDHSLKHPGK